MKFPVFAVLLLLLSCNGSFGQSEAAKGTSSLLGSVFSDVVSTGSRLTSYIADTFSSMISKISSTFEGYHTVRSKIMSAEEQLMTGSSLTLNQLETRVNEMFLQYKTNELYYGRNNSNLHAPGLHFFRAKPIIEKSKVFHFLRKMPKGGILHMHNTAAVSSKWVTEYLSYMPGLLRCTDAKGQSILSFRTSADHGCTSSYVSVSEERSKSFNATTYDAYFEKLINLKTPNPESDYHTIDVVWNKFQHMFDTLGDALKYVDAFRAFHWQMLKEMYEDNVMYAEIRTGLGSLYDSSGASLPEEQTVTELLGLVNEFKRANPGFFGIKLIVTTARQKASDAVLKKLENFSKLHSKYPNFIVGFDLVGQEDLGRPLIEFVENAVLSPEPMYFFHAGETNQFGATDQNLFDAILLHSKRIGHGYMLMKHPLLREIVKQRQIALEICPISNQVLRLTSDLRNHPAGIFLSEGLPIVISNDDPGFWDARGLSYDFYYAIMSFASEQSGLRMLKSLALNSLKYSSMTQAEQRMAEGLWLKDWRSFLNDVIKGNVF